MGHSIFINLTKMADSLWRGWETGKCKRFYVGEVTKIIWGSLRQGFLAFPVKPTDKKGVLTQDPP